MSRGHVAMGRIFFLGAALFTIARAVPTATPPAGQCGRPVIDPALTPGDRIIGGTEAVPGSWPWLVAFQLHHALPIDRHFCGGALIDNRHVLTASHCFRYIPSIVHPLVRVHVGSHQRESRDQTEYDVGVKHVCEHRASYKTYNDIAIIKLDEDIPLSDFIQPICLPNYSITDILPEDTELYTAGWGRIDRDDEGALAEVLKQLKTKTISSEECQKRISVKLLDTIMCTEHVSGSTCHGDSGGPVVRRDDNGTWFLEGVISGGPRKCSGTATPMRFTRVSRFVRWVDEYRLRDANRTLEDFCKPVDAKTSDDEPEESMYKFLAHA